MRLKNLIIFGTRPEAIKMAPLYKEFLKHNDKFDTRICITAQHREILDQVLDFFEIIPNYDLDIMKPNQNLYSLTSDILMNLKPILEEFKPNYVFVHGDTTTTMSASLAAFYAGAKVCHVEAGLRTFNKKSPFPEEVNRCVTGVISDYNFAPTTTSRANLLAENKKSQDVLVTGNTVIDALLFSIQKVNSKGYENEELDKLKGQIDLEKKIILVTGHRRENHGEGIIKICNALRNIAEENEDVQIIYPVHPNPNIKKPVFKLLNKLKNVLLIEPLSYPSFVWLMEKAYLIITDSGGVQEEAPSIGKPVLVMRDTTERPEAVDAGTVILVGTDTEEIISQVSLLLNNSEKYNNMKKLHNPYGDGSASKKIVDYIIEVNN
jgi:UDP-N-acetylglucosamine 2-epimerase (non-hydrolysing)